LNNVSEIALWRVDTGGRVRAISTGYLGLPTALAWRPNGGAIASAGGADDAVRIWNAQTGEPDGQPLTGPTKETVGLSFSPDGHHLAGLVTDSDPWLWDISMSPPRGTALRGDEGLVNTVGFSADGRRLLTVAPTHYASAKAGFPQTGNVFDAPDMTPSAVRVWDTDTGELAGPPVTGRGGRAIDREMDLAEGEDEVPISAAAISPDGQRLLVSTVKGLRLYDPTWLKLVHTPGADLENRAAEVVG
jgi:WD40 repeat protein